LRQALQPLQVLLPLLLPQQRPGILRVSWQAGVAKKQPDKKCPPFRQLESLGKIPRSVSCNNAWEKSTSADSWWPEEAL
jgi:hypothetical protein